MTDSEQYVNPYTNPAHRSWVAKGMCDSISRRSVWCDHRTDHDGKHSWDLGVFLQMEHDRNRGVRFDEVPNANRAMR